MGTVLVSKRGYYLRKLFEISFMISDNGERVVIVSLRRRSLLYLDILSAV